MDYVNIISIVLFSLLAILTFLFYPKTKNTNDFNVVRFMSRVAIFGAISSLLYTLPIFSIHIPIFPAFLDFHFDEIPAFICGYAYGPASAFAVLLIKTVIKLPFTTSLCVGEFSDLILSTIYIIPACLVYEKNRNFKGFLSGIIIFSIVQLASSLILNIYVLIPFYESLMGFSEESLLYLMQLAIPSIKDVGWSYGLLAVLPFNLIKDVLVFLFTFLIYRKIHLLLRFDGRKGIKKA